MKVSKFLMLWITLALLNVESGIAARRLEFCGTTIIAGGSASETECEETGRYDGGAPQVDSKGKVTPKGKSRYQGEKKASSGESALGGVATDGSGDGEGGSFDNGQILGKEPFSDDENEGLRDVSPASSRESGPDLPGVRRDIIGLEADITGLKSDLDAKQNELKGFFDQDQETVSRVDRELTEVRELERETDHLKRESMRKTDEGAALKEHIHEINEVKTHYESKFEEIQTRSDAVAKELSSSVSEGVWTAPVRDALVPEPPLGEGEATKAANEIVRKSLVNRGGADDFENWINDQFGPPDTGQPEKEGFEIWLESDADTLAGKKVHDFAKKIDSSRGEVVEGRQGYYRAAKNSAMVADGLAIRGDDQNVDAWLDLGKQLLDIATDLGPAGRITGPLKSIANLMGGQNLITGEEFSYVDYSVEFLNIATAGYFGAIKGIGAFATSVARKILGELRKRRFAAAFSRPRMMKLYHDEKLAFSLEDFEKKGPERYRKLLKNPYKRLRNVYNIPEVYREDIKRFNRLSMDYGQHKKVINKPNGRIAKGINAKIRREAIVARHAELTHPGVKEPFIRGYEKIDYYSSLEGIPYDVTVASPKYRYKSDAEIEKFVEDNIYKKINTPVPKWDPKLLAKGKIDNSNLPVLRNAKGEVVTTKPRILLDTSYLTIDELGKLRALINKRLGKRGSKKYVLEVNPGRF